MLSSMKTVDLLNFRPSTLARFVSAFALALLWAGMLHAQLSTTATIAAPLLGNTLAINAITATCTGTVGAISGATNVVGGTLLGAPLAANPAANTTLTIPLIATVVLNEQIVNPEHRNFLIPCAPKHESAADKRCATQFLSSVGRLLYRRPMRKAIRWA